MNGFVLDENMNPDLQEELTIREPGLSVYFIGDGRAPPFGTLDPAILIWLEAHDCMLVTHNRSTMPVHLTAHILAGRHVPGIIVIPDDMALGAIIDELRLIWGAGLPEEFQDRIIYLPVRNW